MRALVTGAGARLGQAMAVYLGQRGYDVAVHYAQSQAGADDTVAQLHAMGRKAVAIQADLLDADATAALLPNAAAALGGPITVLINNASIFEYDNITTATQTSWDRHMGSNLRAPFFLTQALAAQAPQAQADAQGEPVAAALVVNMIDQRVQKLTPEFMTYTLAKMGLWALTQTAAQSLAPHVRAFKNNGNLRLVGFYPRSYPQMSWMPFLLSAGRYHAVQRESRIVNEQVGKW